MINKIFTLLIRVGITFGLGYAIGASVDGIPSSSRNAPILVASVIWIFGGIYSLLKFNDSYNILALTNTENKIAEVIDEKNKKKIEDNMLRIKSLYDNGILTQDEYDQKIKTLKDNYL